VSTARDGISVLATRTPVVKRSLADFALKGPI